MTEVLESLARPELPPLPGELDALVSDYWQAQPTLRMLSEGRSLLARSAPKIARVLQDFRSSRSLEAIWAEHPGVLIAGALIAVWAAAVCAPRLKSGGELDEWLEVLLPVSRYLEPALSAEPRRGWEEARRQLQNEPWVAGWIGEPGQARRIAAYAAGAGVIRNRTDYDRRRRGGVEHLLTGIQIVLGQGPLPPGSITKLLPGVEPAPGVDGLPAPGKVTLPSSSRPQPVAAPLLPLDYVARAELSALVSQLTAAPPEAVRAIVLSGITGAGKTTLAAGLARESAVVAAFPDGILWSTTDQGDVLEDLCRQAGLVGWDNEAWAARWRRWAGEPARRALVILDDVVDSALLVPIAGDLGPQMALLVTTQFGDAVAAELARWLPAATIQRLDVEGLNPEDARSLFENILGRELGGDEIRMISEVGELLGRHAGALAFAAIQAREYGWEGLLAGLREGGLPSDRLRRMVQRQWERLAAEQQADLSALVRYARGRGPFGSPYAMAAWNLKNVELTETRLTQLARAGLIERLQAQPGSLYLSPALWRVAPAVERALHEVGTSALAADVRRALDRSRLASRLQGQAGSLLHVPWQFQLLATAWWLVWGVLKLIVEAPLWVYTRVAHSPELLRRWRMWTLPESTEEHLQRQWQRLGLEPTQEVRLIYDARTVEGVGKLVAVVAGVAALALLGAFSLSSLALRGYGWGLGILLLLAVGVVYWILRPVIWRAWLTHLYGVRTWDLRMIVWTCRVLRMQDRPVESNTQPGSQPQ